MKQIVLILIIVGVIMLIKQIEIGEVREVCMYIAGIVYGVTAVNLRRREL